MHYRVQHNKVKRVNIRMTRWDMEKAQALAMREGIPYATLLTRVC
jgi:predicted DNA binding CopG/RHH family protein